MATFLIGYDLNRPNRDDAYADLFGAIKQASNGTWWHHLDSTWIIHSDKANETAILNELLPHIDDNDEILVVRLVGTGAWYGFNQKGSDWLKQNL
jgi:hypothetical protein